MPAGTIYRFRFNVDGNVVHWGITTYLTCRECEHRGRWPTGRIEVVGPATTREAAWRWERRQAEQGSTPPPDVFA